MIQPHIKLEKVDYVCLIAGNPDRIQLIADHLNEVKKISEHRGLIAYKGITPQFSIPITLISTGMGSGSASIVIEEAYRAGARVIIRIGSTGSLQPEDEIGTIFIPNAAVRDEGTTSQYLPSIFPAVPSPDLYNALVQSAYELEIEHKSGIVWSTDVYYHPNVDEYKKWSNIGVACVEMECSTLFILGSHKGIQTGAILTSDGNLNDAENDIYKGDILARNKTFQNSVVQTIKIVINAIDKGW